MLVLLMALASVTANFRLCLLALAGLLLTALASLADDQSPSQELSAEEVAYRQAIAQRAERIVAAIDIDDEAKRDRIAKIIAEQYRTLRDIHDRRDSELAALHKNSERVPESGDKAEPVVEAERAVIAAHREFVAKLAAELPAESVDGVKDGMTYGVVPITYNAYLNLLPDLKDEEKRKIKACLLEAREYAMDAGSSEEKHAWFGKYKGRINNYLSDRGYDLKQAERELAERQKADGNQ